MSSTFYAEDEPFDEDDLAALVESGPDKDDPDAIVEFLLTGNEVEVAEWWIDNGSTLDRDVKDEVESGLAEQGYPTTTVFAFPEQIAEGRQYREDNDRNDDGVVAPEEPAEQAEYDDRFERDVEREADRLANILGSNNTNPDLVGEDAIRVPNSVDPQDRDRFVQEVARQASEKDRAKRSERYQAEGATKEEADALADAELSGAFGNFEEPDWILANGTLSDEEKARIVEYWNDNNGTSFQTFAELVATGELDTETALNGYIVNSARLDVEPMLQFSIELPGRGNVTLSQEEIEILRSTYGMSNDAITRTVRLAAQRQDMNADDVDVFGLAALARYYGMAGRTDSIVGEGISTGTGALDEAEDREGRLKELDREIKSLTAHMEALPQSEWTSDYRADRAELIRERNRLQMQAAGPGSAAAGIDPSGTSPLAAESYATGQGVGALSQRYNRGLEIYRQNQTLAVIHAVDPMLASRIAESGGSADKLSAEDNAAAYDLLIRTGVVQRDKRSGFRPDDFIANQFESYFAVGQERPGRGGGGGGGGPTRRVIDPVTVQAQVESLWRAYYRSAPPPGVADALTATLQAQLDNADPGQEFDLTSRIKAFVLGRQEYNTLYSQKPGGTTEEEWQALFQSGAQSILGNEGVIQDEAIKSGMQTGDYQTTVGMAAASKVAQNNSRWKERLALAANKFADMT